MKIYSIYHVYDESYGLSAVVVANSEAEAVAVLDLGQNDVVKSCCEIGIYTGDSAKAFVAADETFC